MFDIGIIGAGPGGYVAAIKGAQMGANVIIFEKEHLGGVCLNKGCVPTKTLLKSARLFSEIKRAGQFGIDVSGFGLDYTKMVKRKDSVVKQLSNGIAGLLRKNKVTVVNAEASVASRNSIQAGGIMYDVKNIILATGSIPAMPPIPGVEHAVDSDYILNLDALPESIAIVGGGVIGVEFAVLLAGLGVKATIFEMLPRVLSMADGDVIFCVEKKLKNLDIDVYSGVKVVEIKQSGVTFERQGDVTRIGAEIVLVCTGRVPNVDTDMLDKLGIRHTGGVIDTDEYLRTNINGIYAIGDLNGKSMLAHTAQAEGIAAVENIKGKSTVMRYDRIPYCVYTNPEIAWVGISEEKASGLGIDYITGIFPMSANGKNVAEGETEGIIKLIANAKTKELLGAHLVCTNATDMISGLAVLMESEGTIEELSRVIHPHPTISEGIHETAEALLGSPIHI